MLFLFNCRPHAKKQSEEIASITVLFARCDRWAVSYSVTNQILHCGSVSLCAEHRRRHSCFHRRVRCRRSKTDIIPQYKIEKKQLQKYLPVVSKVALDQVACSERRHEGQLSSKYCATHYSCKCVSILARFYFTGTYTRKIKLISCWYLKILVGLKFVPLTRRMSRQEAWAGRVVPPPIVPISMEGIVQVTYRSLPSSPHGSIRVMQLLLPTFCAGSWNNKNLGCLVLGNAK